MNMSTLAALPMPIKVGAGALAGLVLAGGAAGVTLLATRSTPAAHNPPAATSAAPPRNQVGGIMLKTIRETCVKAAAQTLGIEADALTADLHQGQTLKQLSAGRFASVDAFSAALMPNLKSLLDQDVAQQLITVRQEQTFLQALQSGRLPYWGAPDRMRAQPPTLVSPRPRR